jgi:hypothetical protein
VFGGAGGGGGAAGYISIISTGTPVLTGVISPGLTLFPE